MSALPQSTLLAEVFNAVETRDGGLVGGLTGAIDTGLAGSSFWCNANVCKTMVFASTPSGYVRNDLLLHSSTPASFECIGGTCQIKPAAQPQTQLASAQTEAGSLPSFQTQDAAATLPVFETAPMQKSLSRFCSKVNLLTSSNGGITSVSTISEPNVAGTVPASADSGQLPVFNLGD